jgi:hypothetical protein
MVGGYIHNHENERGGEILSKAFTKDGKVQWKTVEKQIIFDHCASKSNIQGFAQIMIVNNKLKPFVKMLPLKSKEMSIPRKINEVSHLKL